MSAVGRLLLLLLLRLLLLPLLPAAGDTTANTTTTTTTAAAAAAAAANDDDGYELVCLTGYIMDRFCLKRGTLMDAPTARSLSRPDLHSLHCLLDIKDCRASGYEVLADPENGAGPKDGEERYTRAFALDWAGNAMVLALGRATGSTGAGCTTCTGGGAGGGGGGLKAGLRATVTGRFDPAYQKVPRRLLTESVAPAGTPCAKNATAYDGHGRSAVRGGAGGSRAAATAWWRLGVVAGGVVGVSFSFQPPPLYW
jgi:hypothetical protein